MKTISTIALIILSNLTYAEGGAINSLLSIIPSGSFQGKLDNGLPCSVEVKVINGFFKNVALVSASSDTLTVVKEVEEGSDYRVGRLGKQNVLFFQDTKKVDSSDDVNYTEDSIRIINANNNLTNIAVENRLVQNTESESASVSCSVKIK